MSKKNQGYSTIRSGVLLKICFKAFFVHWEVLYIVYKVEIYLKSFHTLNYPEFWDSEWSFEDKL